MKDLIIYITLFVILFFLEIVYFKFAEKFNIIDKPNLRSSHTDITLRGGGIVFYLGSMAFYLYSSFQYTWFFIGLSLMAFVSFLDDILTLSNKIRLLVHFGSVLLMAYQLDALNLPWYYLLTIFVVVVGVINAYNFMDGINGITASYSLAIVILLSTVNSEIGFVNQELLSFLLISILVFSFFNFRTKARTFAGDVGSVSIAYILLFALGALIIKTGNLIYILFLTVYGIDTIWTIIQRLFLGENIFDAHRSHLYQYLGNEYGMNKLLVSFLYGIIQLLIGVTIIWITNYDISVQLIYAISLLGGISIVYLIIKKAVMKSSTVEKL